MRLRRLLDTADVAAYALAHRGDAPVVDTGLQWVTRSADFSAVWLATGAALATTQGRSGRRAAARGLLAVALTSALTNGPMKSLTRRPRPDNRLIPMDRIRHRTTRTSSLLAIEWDAGSLQITSPSAVNPTIVSRCPSVA